MALRPILNSQLYYQLIQVYDGLKIWKLKEILKKKQIKSVCEFFQPKHHLTQISK